MTVDTYLQLDLSAYTNTMVTGQNSHNTNPKPSIYLNIDNMSIDEYDTNCAGA